MKRHVLFLLTLSLLLFGAIPLFAAISVVSVKGAAAYSAGRNWVPLAAGMQLQEGVKISTGLKSTVVLKLSRSTVTVQPLSMMKIYEDKATARTSDTRIGLKRGGLRAEVTRGKEVKTVFRIATPVATSSVRGTKKEVLSGFYGASFSALDGSFEVISRNGQRGLVYGNLSFSQRRDMPKPMRMRRDPGTKIGDPNVTGDEMDSQLLFDSDIPEGSGDASDSFNGDVKVLLGVQFPD